MPTVRPRHQITETSPISRAIDLAAKRWPGESRADLLRRLVVAGADNLEEDDNRVENSRREAILTSSGAYGDAFGTGYLDDLRRDWPS